MRDENDMDILRCERCNSLPLRGRGAPYCVRTNGLEQANRTGYKVQVHEIESGIVLVVVNGAAYLVDCGPGGPAVSKT